jgi:hypothetical protein
LAIGSLDAPAHGFARFPIGLEEVVKQRNGELPLTPGGAATGFLDPYR